MDLFRSSARHSTSSKNVLGKVETGLVHDSKCFTFWK